ncbi:MAG: SpoIID/LytB domain-containing protein [Gammaproteobacteria bacterium]
MTLPDREPLIRVGLLEAQSTVKVTLCGNFRALNDVVLPAGDYRFDAADDAVRLANIGTAPTIRLQPIDNDATFELTAAVGHDFHWSEAETQRFEGALSLVATNQGLTVINEIPLERYLTCVVCSEMAADCPLALIEAHSVISRSWLLAQRDARSRATAAPAAFDQARINTTITRWYDQSSHALFDVCAEDHCQRYHGLGRVRTDTVLRAIDNTRGQVLSHAGSCCDTRYSKCCGGLTEDARVAWSDEPVPFLVSFFDGDASAAHPSSAAQESEFAVFLQDPPPAYCHCDRDDVLDLILPERDRRTTPDFFRWQESIPASDLSDRVREKLELDLGRVTALEPVSRGASGRLWQLTIVGEQGRVTIGKELEIRRVLSDTHLLSSAFRVETRGPSTRPDTFVLHGAGRGHGVGLCQIGAAIMALNGDDCGRILKHYFPGTHLTAVY